MSAKVKKTILVAAALFAVSLTEGCNYSVSKRTSLAGAGESQGATTSPNPTGDHPLPPSADLNFDNVFAKSIKTSCFGCHAAPRNASGINLETYESVFANRKAIAQAVSSKFMPDSMGRTMDDGARGLLIRWLAAGAPKTAGSITSDPQAMLVFETDTHLLKMPDTAPAKDEGVQNEVEL